MGVQFFFTAIQRLLKATSPPQELEVGASRAPYLLVYIYIYLPKIKVSLTDKKKSVHTSMIWDPMENAWELDIFS